MANFIPREYVFNWEALYEDYNGRGQRGPVPDELLRLAGRCPVVKEYVSMWRLGTVPWDQMLLALVLDLRKRLDRLEAEVLHRPRYPFRFECPGDGLNDAGRKIVQDMADRLVQMSPAAREAWLNEMKRRLDAGGGAAAAGRPADVAFDTAGGPVKAGDRCMCLTAEDERAFREWQAARKREDADTPAHIVRGAPAPPGELVMPQGGTGGVKAS